MRLLIFLCFPFWSIAQITDTLQLQTTLNSVSETSGLLWHNEHLWTHNDSGGKAELYQINPQTGATERTVVLAGITNTDWEDLAQDATHFYIGDFGNNVSGNRQDLVIYKIPFTQLIDNPSDTIANEFIESIPFFYPEQTDFTAQAANRTDFDCEAMFVFNNQIHLFTKEWTREQTTHYILPTITTDTLAAQKVTEYDLTGLVTAADISPTGKEIFLLAYEDVTEQGSGKNGTFGLVFRDFSEHDFLSGETTRIEYTGGYFANGQIEGVAYRNKDELWISAEEVLIFPARLYTASLLKTPLQSINPSLIAIKIYPNPTADSVKIEFLEKISPPFIIQLVDINGQQLMQRTINTAIDTVSLNLPQLLSANTYGLQILDKNGQIISSQKLQIAK